MTKAPRKSRRKTHSPGRRRLWSSVAVILLVALAALALRDTSSSERGPEDTTTQAPPPSSRSAIAYGYEVVRTYPHDSTAFTQGLVWADEKLYEGTGLEGASSLRRVTLESGKVEKRLELQPHYFGEGIALWGDSIIQLTYRKGVAFVYDRNSFDLRKTFQYDTQGWGITHDGSRLIMSDGTSTLYFRDPDTFEETGRIEVVLDGEALIGLNELEYIEGEVFANVWPTNRIVRIAPETGVVTGVVDLEALLSSADRGGVQVDVLNGIAYDAETKRIFVTGKNWPKLYEIRLVPR